MGDLEEAKQLLGEMLTTIENAHIAKTHTPVTMRTLQGQVTDTLALLDNMEEGEALDIIMDVHGVYWLRGRDAEFCINLEYDNRGPIVQKYLRREVGVEEPPPEEPLDEETLRRMEIVADAIKDPINVDVEPPAEEPDIERLAEVAFTFAARYSVHGVWEHLDVESKKMWTDTMSDILKELGREGEWVSSEEIDQLRRIADGQMTCVYCEKWFEPRDDGTLHCSDDCFKADMTKKKATEEPTYDQCESDIDGFPVIGRLPAENLVRDCKTCKIWIPHGFGPVDQDQIEKDACHDCSIEGREGWTPKEPPEESEWKCIQCGSLQPATNDICTSCGQLQGLVREPGEEVE